MKVLFTHRYFWPDTAPYAVMLRSIARSAVRDDQDVHVFASIPSYRDAPAAPKSETIDGMNIRRTWVFAERRGNFFLRVLNVAIYCVALFFHILRKRPDVVTASSFPPVIAGLSAALAARLTGAKFMYHLQDVHPDVSVYAGGRMGRWPIVGILRALEGIARRSAARIVVLSEDMRDTVIAGTKGKLPPIEIINNLALDSFGAPVAPPAELQKPAGKRRVIFAGNLGRFQDLPALADGVIAGIAGRDDVEVLFLGDGDARAALFDKWGDHPQVKFGPFLPFAQARELIETADVGLVSLSRDIYRVSYPSKVLTYIGLGLPMLAFVESNSQLARTIEAEGLGTVPADASPEAIADAMRRILDEPDRRAAVQAYCTREATSDVILAKWQALVAEVGRG